MQQQGEFHRHYIEQKRPDIKVCIPYNSICRRFKNKQN